MSHGRKGEQVRRARWAHDVLHDDVLSVSVKTVGALAALAARPSGLELRPVWVEEYAEELDLGAETVRSALLTLADHGYLGLGGDDRVALVLREAA
jgi:DNA-binding IclR family transcriptional regulator